MKIIQQGAEAVLIREDNFILKRRAKKGYRINELDDKLRKQRTRKEAKLLERARKFINVPAVKKSDDNKMEIEMEFISGLKLSENLDNLKNWKVRVILVRGKNYWINLERCCWVLLPKVIMVPWFILLISVWDFILRELRTRQLTCI